MVSATQANATAVPVVINGFLLGATVTSGGAGYLAVPNVQIVGGSGIGAGGYAIVSNRMVSAVIMTNAGWGYTTPPSIVIDPPSALILTNQTNSTLALSAVTNRNLGNYFVVVTNIYGSVTSSVAGLQMVASLQPQNFFGSNINGQQISLQFSGAPNYPYILQTATNLTPPMIWQSVFTNPADGNGYWQFTDTNLNSPQKFYRVLTH
jgi:hypothetical protein